MQCLLLVLKSVRFAFCWRPEVSPHSQTASSRSTKNIFRFVFNVSTFEVYWTASGSDCLPLPRFDLSRFDSKRCGHEIPFEILPTVVIWMSGGRLNCICCSVANSNEWSTESVACACRQAKLASFLHGLTTISNEQFHETSSLMCAKARHRSEWIAYLVAECNERQNQRRQWRRLRRRRWRQRRYREQIILLRSSELFIKMDGK